MTALSLGGNCEERTTAEAHEANTPMCRYCRHRVRVIKQAGVVHLQQRHKRPAYPCANTARIRGEVLKGWFVIVSKTL